MFTICNILRLIARTGTEKELVNRVYYQEPLANVAQESLMIQMRTLIREWELLLSSVICSTNSTNSLVVQFSYLSLPYY